MKRFSRADADRPFSMPTPVGFDFACFAASISAAFHHAVVSFNELENVSILSNSAVGLQAHGVFQCSRFTFKVSRNIEDLLMPAFMAAKRRV